MRPIFKKGNRMNIENYRPIVIFCNFGKLFQMVIYNILCLPQSKRIYFIYNIWKIYNNKCCYYH